ncbi:MAG TPA: protein translocase subunit SecF, partial [Spirochaetota bacterium]|nr:protein translocase subunit SecF [Spirochaetota bacterium]
IRFSPFFALCSVILVCISLYLVTIHSGFDYGTDFTGGVELIVNFNKDPGKDALVSFYNDAGYDTAVQGMDSDQGYRYIIRVPMPEDEAKAERVENNVKQVLHAAADAGKISAAFTIVQSTTIGSVISDEYIQSAFMIIIAAMIAIILYITLRFQYKYSIAAILAVLHDVLIMLGFISLLKIQFNRMSIIAILTIFGYSVNDTIVLFDRIRELIKENIIADYKATVNRAINNVLVRTLITSLTTLLVVGALYYNTTGVTKDFAFVLMIGLLSGTYSSIYIASGFMLFLNYLKNKKTGSGANASA